MIVRQKQNEIECIKQHDHAHISGVVAEHWIEAVHPDVTLGIFEHDRAWIPLDQIIEKDPERGLPHDFISYPLEPKLKAYISGVDEVQEKSLYGAFLCSMHYCSFFTGTITSKSEVKQFLDHENSRQEQLLKQLQMDKESDQIVYDFKLLQFCDDLSLYICMNHPGTAKSDEVSWFREGFTQTFSFAPTGIKAEWVNTNEVKLDPFPFTKPLTLSFPVYLVPVPTVQSIDHDWPMDQLEHYTQTVTFVR